ncbi:hypothetical protein KUTeg_008298 [Tegillarca granosa]|uniref:Peroxisomal bifunctional enzyme n=1 Tax=Tegillarca granosa TaxID=220873 RepID=A0ABQ9FD05_TEGGR|nr:hypothetical protein KUTeg_008298 [Tegillarca granosa]
MRSKVVCNCRLGSKCRTGVFISVPLRSTFCVGTSYILAVKVSYIVAVIMVDYKVQGSFAILEVNNPPVNALSHAVRSGLNDGIEKASRDRNVKAVIVCGKGATFPAGADIREFSKPKKEPWLPEIGHKMEKCEKPVIAAIHGTCLGGGLEIALFCHYRIALKTARVGFPEVQLGLLPGAAGTQRLPRVAGLQVAMDMISSGRHVLATEAKKYGIIDELCLKAVKASVDFPYEKGLEMETEFFKQLLGSGQSKAQQYAFFAERTIARWEMPNGNYRTAVAKPVKSTAVIGAGTMGSGIVVCLLSAGIPVYLMEQNEKFLNNGLKMIKSIMEGSVKLGKVSPEVGRKAATLLKPTMNYNDLKDVDLIPVLVKTCRGFLANRMHGPFGTEGTFLVEEGALPSQVDRVMEDFGLPIGPFKVRDLSGVDIAYKIKQEVAKLLGIKTTLQTRFMNGERYCALNDRLFHLGRLGRKTGKGYYKYEKAGGKIATEDSDVTDIIEKHCKELGIQRRQISSQEIVERMMYSCINEGFKILEDGIAVRPEDIDVCYLYGFSFPRYLGGPMFYANQIGLQRVYERICYYHENFPYSPHWVPSRLLRKLAAKSVPMNEWMAYATGSKL